MFEECLKVAEERLLSTIERIRDTSRYPIVAPHGSVWETADSSHWASGFFPGCLWYMYELTGEKKWQDYAEEWTASIEIQKSNITTHDLGFMILCSFGQGYRLTENTKYKDIILEASESLAKRYEPSVGCIRSWGLIGDNSKFIVIIDNMMNLEMLFWASKNGGSKKLHDIAVSHAFNTMKNQIRDDGSSIHILDYDISNGEFRYPDPKIIYGINKDTCWSRGLAWALYGFTVAYRETKDIKFLETAEKIARYYILNLPSDKVPYWDFTAKDKPDERKDVSSASIGASALLELSALTEDSTKSEEYFSTAKTILNSISRPPYLNNNSKSFAILEHAAYGRVDLDAKNPEGISLIFADYYFLEALSRYLKILKSPRQ